MTNKNDNNGNNLLYQEFQCNGFVGPLDIITPEEANIVLKDVRKELFQTTDTTETETTTTTTTRNKLNSNNRFKLHLIIPSISKIVHDPKLLLAVRQVLGWKNNNDHHNNNEQQHDPQQHQLLLWSSDINIKYPQSPGYFAPHQDSTFAGLKPANQCVTVWIALSDPVGISEGCLFFYPKSHLLGQLPHYYNNHNKKDNNNCNNTNHHQQQSVTLATTTATTTTNTTAEESTVIRSTSSNKNQKDNYNQQDDKKEHSNNNNNNSNNMLSLGQYIDESLLQKYQQGKENNNNIDAPIAIPLRAGQATIHSFLSVHFSGPNHHSQQPRVGLALRFITSNVRQTKGIEKEMVTWIPLSSSSLPNHSNNNDNNKYTSSHDDKLENSVDNNNNNQSHNHDDSLIKQSIQKHFDLEPILSQNPTKEEIQRGYQIRKEAMRREEANYFSVALVVSSTTTNTSTTSSTTSPASN